MGISSAMKSSARDQLRRARRHINSMRAQWPYVEQGRGTYGDYRVRFWTGDPEAWVRIGNYTSIAAGTELIIGGGHRPDWASNYPFRLNFQLPGALHDGLPVTRGDINIGSDVWVGRNATILSGVTIGHGAVIAAGSVVAQRVVRPYALMAGNPAREKRRRFDDDTVNALLEVAWWDWPEEEIVSVVHLLNGADVHELLDYARDRGSDTGPERAGRNGNEIQMPAAGTDDR